MQYVLGNMLNGGGINPDGLSLDLQFAADKTLTARRGPTPTFTRASGATYFGPLVDIGNYEFATTGITNGRASWFISDEGTDITISYTGTRWRVATVDNGDEFIYLAAPGGEWRPDQADWSGEAISVTTSSTFGIVKAANNEPRFDHDPVTGVCRGLLIEESRTNQMQFSEDFTDSFWSGFPTATVANVASTSPSGGSTSSSFTAISGISDARFRLRITTISSGSTAFTYSCFIKAGTSDFGTVGLQFNKLGIGPIRICNANIVFSTGVITKSGLSNADFTVSSTALPNGWYRISISGTSNASTAVEDQVVCAQGLSFNGVGGSGTFAGTETVLAWGAQLEAGSFATSYIPTTTAPLTCSADVCSITGEDFTSFYNQSEGTFFADVTPQTVAQAALVVGVNTTTFQNSHMLYKTNPTASAAGKRWAANTNAAGPTQSSLITTPTDIAGSRGILSYAYKLNDMAFAVNGTLIGTDNTGTMPFPTVMLIGSRDDGLSINGPISEVKYFKKRLPNAKLQALTAP
jgi:hypothetical protein